MNAPVPVTAEIELANGMSLLFQESAQKPGDYPTSIIQKGAILVVGNKELAEEGLGFGVPMLKYGHEVVFPSSAQISVSQDDNKSFVVEADYSMNLVQKMFILGKRIDCPTFYKIKESFSPLCRKCAPLRRIGTWASTRLRLALEIENRFENVASRGIVRTVYVINDCKDTVHISIDLSRLESGSFTEFIIANEQGANHFDHYSDSEGGKLAKKGIGIWNEVFADEASFIDTRNRIEFKLRKMKAAKMFRGWELLTHLLAWSGLNYVLPPDTTAFDYDIKLGTAE